MKNDRGISNRKDGWPQRRPRINLSGAFAPRVTRAALAASVIAATPALWPGTVLAGAVIDSSWGRTPQTLSGQFTIPEAAGKLAGTNLFHSFLSFSINTNESATFTTNTTTIQNVISRVTGTGASSINGPLSLQAAPGSAPNFFFINPNGVTFGPGAQVNVPASFHVTTANNLRFSDGTVFTAGAGPDNTLTVAAPEAFGFLGGNAKVSFNGVQADGQAGRAAFAASSLDVTAASIEFDNSSISIPGAAVRMVATGPGAMAVPVSGTPLASGTGSVHLTGSLLDVGTVNAGDAGSIELNGGPVTLDDSSLNANVTGNGTHARAGGSIRINATGDLTVLGSSKLAADVFALAGGLSPGWIKIFAAGDIIMAPKSTGSVGPTIESGWVNFQFPIGDTTRGISIEGKSVSLTNTLVSGASPETFANPISILSHGNLSLQRSQVSANGSGGGEGPAGNVTLKTLGGGDVSITDSSVTSHGSLRPSGKIEVDACDGASCGRVSLNNGTVSADNDGGATGPIDIRGAQILMTGTSRISASQFSGPQSRGGGIGSVELTATDRISLSDSSTVEARSIGSFTNPEDAAPGQIRLTTPMLVLNDAAKISTETSGNVSASNIVITSPKSSDGSVGDLTISSNTGSGTITSAAVLDSTGNAGNITIGARNLNMDNINVLSEAGAGTSGQAGSISIAASKAASITGSRISTDTSGQGGAGNVSITAKGLSVDSTEISSAARAGSSGQTGSVAVSVTDVLGIVDGSSINTKNEATVAAPTSVVSETLSVSARNITMDGSEITSDSSGNVNAGNVDVKFGTLLALRNSGISATAQNANGGAISVGGGRTLTLDSSQITTSVLGGAGNAGSIAVNTNTLLVRTGFIQANAVGPGAFGGDITIGVNTLIPIGPLLIGGSTPIEFQPGLRFNVIQAAAPNGVSGAVNITNPW